MGLVLHRDHLPKKIRSLLKNRSKQLQQWMLNVRQLLLHKRQPIQAPLSINLPLSFKPHLHTLLSRLYLLKTPYLEEALFIKAQHLQHLSRLSLLTHRRILALSIRLNDLQ
jgi:hypothetical protein